MAISTEQAAINKFYPDDDTKTISDVVTEFIKFCSTESSAISSIKGLFPDVSDWSI